MQRKIFAIVILTTLLAGLMWATPALSQTASNAVYDGPDFTQKEDNRPDPLTTKQLINSK